MQQSITISSIIDKIKAVAAEKSTFTVAIDGRCASGKTTLAARLGEALDCNIIHTDDFYLQGSQRTEKRYAEPGGNLDRERLSQEVLIPLSKGLIPVYIPFNCSTMSFAEEIKLNKKRIYIIEGSYSCHPELRKFYDLTIFVTTDNEAQRKRILERNGKERLTDFISK